MAQRRQVRSHRVVLASVALGCLGALLVPFGASGAGAAGAPSAPASLYTPELLQNPSFELGAAHWAVSPGQNLAVYSGTAAEDTHYAETNTGTAGSRGSIWQTVNSLPTPGHGYQGWLSLRSPTTTAVAVRLSLTAAGGRVAPQSRATSFLVRKPTWVRVPVELDVTRSGYTRLRLQLAVITTGANVDLDAASLSDTGLKNGSFEQGFAHWKAVHANVAVYRGKAAEATHYLETNRISPGAAVYQNVATTPVLGHSYRAQVLVRSPAGARAKVALSLVAKQGPRRRQGATTVVTVASPSWTLASVELDITASGENHLRFQITPLTPGVNVDADAASLFDTTVKNASFERARQHWATSPGQNLAVYRHGLEDSHYLETNTGSAGVGASVYQDVASTVVQGDALEGWVALRSPQRTPAVVDVALWALGGPGGAQGQSTKVTLTSAAWVRVPVELDASSAGHTDLRLQVYLDTANENVDMDAAQISQAPGVGGLDALRSSVLTTSVSQDQHYAAITERPLNTNCNKYSTFWRAGTQAPCDGNGFYSESWCSDFAAWVWHQAGVSFTWGTAGGDLNGWSYSFVEWGVANGTLKLGAQNHPVPGDAVVWGSTSQAYGQHVGLVVGVLGSLIDVVSGNSGPLDAAGDNVRVWDSGYFNPSTSTINGYGVIGYISPETSAAPAALPAHSAQSAPFLAPTTPAQASPPSKNPYGAVALPGRLTKRQLDARIAAQDAGH